MCQNIMKSKQQGSFVGPKMRVALMVEPCPWSYTCGYTNIFQALLAHLNERKDECEVVTAEIFTEKTPSYLGFPVHYTVGYRFPWSFMTMSLDLTGLGGWVLHRMRPDIIHASSPGLLSVFAILWSRLFRIPLAMSYHTHVPVYVEKFCGAGLWGRIVEWFLWFYVWFVHSFADLNLMTSPQTMQDFIDHGINRCAVWQKAVDTEVFNPRHYSAEMRERMTGGHPEDFLLVYVGRLAKEKRLEDLLEIYNGMPKDARLCIVGSGHKYEQTLRAYFSDADRCIFTGILKGEELSQAFASADVFIMPSDTETLGLTVLESMASGVPVIGAKAGGVQDLIDDGKSGFLVESGDTQAFVERAMQLKHDPVLLRTLSENSRKEAERWSWDAAMTKLRDEQYAIALRNFHDRPSERLFKVTNALSSGKAL